MRLISELRKRNPVLFWFGCLNFFAALVCIVLTQLTDARVLGINAWIKPMKFYFSIMIFCWTMGWYLHELKNKRATRHFSWMAVIVFLFETIVITWQAANGRLSHFNISTPLYSILFNLMGVAITVLAIWTIVIAFHFFRKREFDAPMSYIWGIRLGLILFVIFSFEGGVMAYKLSHTIGAQDGGPGLPVVNWSKQYGDLRVAHFFGMHSLQILPLLGFYVFKTKTQIIIAALIYFAAVMVLFLQAIRGFPLIG